MAVDIHQTFQNRQDRRMIIWDPEKSGINDEINIIDYRGPTQATGETGLLRYAPEENKETSRRSRIENKKEIVWLRAIEMGTPYKRIN